MAKDKLTDLDPVAGNNTDVAGININEGWAASAINNAIRAVLAILAKVNAGTDPVADTWTFGDPADLTKRARLDAGNVAAGQTRVLTMRDANLDLATVFTNVVQQVFTSSGTYTPTAGMVFCIVEAVGGGGAGGGASTITTRSTGGGGGGAGSYSRSRLTAAQIGSSQTVTIGPGGSASTGGGGNGNTTSLGSLLTAPGGIGGGAGGTPSSAAGGAGGAGGSVGTGDVTIIGGAGFPGCGLNTVDVSAWGGAGGASYFGGGPRGEINNSSGAISGNQTGGAYGSGGSGGVACQTASAANGGTGRDGYMIITEFCI